MDRIGKFMTGAALMVSLGYIPNAMAQENYQSTPENFPFGLEKCPGELITTDSNFRVEMSRGPAISRGNVAYKDNGHGGHMEQFCTNLNLNFPEYFFGFKALISRTKDFDNNTGNGPLKGTKGHNDFMASLLPKIILPYGVDILFGVVGINNIDLEEIAMGEVLTTSSGISEEIVKVSTRGDEYPVEISILQAKPISKEGQQYLGKYYHASMAGCLNIIKDNKGGVDICGKYTKGWAKNYYVPGKVDSESVSIRFSLKWDSGFSFNFGLVSNVIKGDDENFKDFDKFSLTGILSWHSSK